MDINSVASLVTTVGFPICACIVMGAYVKYITDKNRNEVAELNKQHKDEMSAVTVALNNNTIALQKLADKLDA